LAADAPTPLPGSYKAWLSIGTGADESPSSRFRQSALGYVRVDGVSVADSYADLIDGSINHAIYAMEDGSALPLGGGNAQIWTNTTISGTEESPGADCDNWTKADPDTTLTGNIGISEEDRIDASWTDQGSVQFCDFEFTRLYCFQQE
jgi:hypothetical protein